MNSLPIGCKRESSIYCRLSREDEEKQRESDESEGIQNQKSMLINYAIEKDWDIYSIYCDEDYSGIDSRRPEFNKLLEDAKNHKFDIVLCKTQSRFTRDMEIVERYLHNKTFDSKRKKGLHIGSFVCYGYKRTKRKDN